MTGVSQMMWHCLYTSLQINLQCKLQAREIGDSVQWTP